MADFPEWIHPGASVAIISGGNWGPPSITMSTVTRVTATQVIVGTRKFKAHRDDPLDLREMGHGSGRYPAPYLLSPESERLAGYREEWRVVGLRNVARTAVDNWLSDSRDHAQARTASHALLTYAEAATN